MALTQGAADAKANDRVDGVFRPPHVPKGGNNLSSAHEDLKGSGTPEVSRWKAKKERIENWLNYYIGWVIGGLFLLWLIVSVVLEYQKKPESDVQVAYVGSERLSDSAIAAIEATLEYYADDGNGDGEVVVNIVQYEIPSIFSLSIAGLAEYLDQTALVSDLELEKSELFLLEDAASFQWAYVRLELPEGNGALPEADDVSGESNSVRWTDCPALMELPLTTGDSGLMLLPGDREAIEALELCLRGYATEESKAAHTCAADLWERIVQGVEPERGGESSST